MTPIAPPRPNPSGSPPRPLATDVLPADDAGREGRWLPMSARQCCVPLLADPAAPAAARFVVGDAIRIWRVPVDADAALLLTSELVTNAVIHGAPGPQTFVLLTIACDAAGLRVDVHDGCDDLPMLDTGVLCDAQTETGRGLLLVTTLSAEWGFYRTPAGKAVYFTLELQRDSSATGMRRSG